MINPKSKKSKLVKGLKKTRAGCSDLLRNRDQFGQPVVLNFKGSDTYKTHIGGLLSMAYIALIVVFLVVKVKQMAANDMLEIETQTMVLEDDELERKYDLGEYDETL